MCLRRIDLHPRRGNNVLAPDRDPAQAMPNMPSTVPASLVSSGRLTAPSAIDGSKKKPNKRRRLWELSSASHCPLIGVCFKREEIRQILSQHVGVDGHEDYELHVLAVSECATRSDVSRAFMKVLNKRFAAAIRRYGQADSAVQIEALWRTDISAGDAPGALWASLSHPACSKLLASKIYGDIHLLQHEAAAQARAGIRLQVNEKRELIELRAQIDSMKTQQCELREALRRQIDQLRNDNLVLARQNRVLLEQGKRAAAKIQSVDHMVADLVAAKDAAEKALRHAQNQVMRLKEQLHARDAVAGAGVVDLIDQETEATTTMPAPADNADPTLTDQDLSGQRILCVGGRPSSISAYRQIIEQMGGRFDHHDGGVEQKTTRLDPSLTGADLVLCLAGHISHDAYWRVKKHCLRTGKRLHLIHI